MFHMSYDPRMSSQHHCIPSLLSLTPVISSTYVRSSSHCSSSMMNYYSSASPSKLLTCNMSNLLPPQYADGNSRVTIHTQNVSNPEQQSTTVEPQQQNSTTQPVFLILADSHGRALPSLTTNDYQVNIRSISGLQWINEHCIRLCTKTLLDSTIISSDLSICTGVIFLIGTNSIRNTYASDIINQIESIVDLIRYQHPHLHYKSNITILSTFPCLNVSSLFPSISLLTTNLNHYNTLLHELALQKKFSILDVPIQSNHLKRDGMHIHPFHLFILCGAIREYIHHLFNRLLISSRFHHRSRDATTRRNHKRHAKLLARQQQQTVIRPIARAWQLHALKLYLKHKQIHYNRLPEIRHHQVRIQFNNIDHYSYVEATISEDEFSEMNYYKWINYEH